MMQDPEIQFRPMAAQDEATTARVQRPRPDRTIPHVERGQQHAGEEPAPGEVHKDVAVAPKTEYVTAQAKTPLRVGIERGLILAALPTVLAIIAILEAHQVGYSWGDSLESAAIQWFKEIAIILGGLTAFGAIDQFRAKRV